MTKDYTGVYSSLGSFCQAHDFEVPDYDDMFSDTESIEQLAGNEYEVIFVKDLSMRLRVQIYEHININPRTDQDEDILVVKSEQVQVVQDNVLGRLGIATHHSCILHNVKIQLGTKGQDGSKTTELDWAEVIKPNFDQYIKYLQEIGEFEHLILKSYGRHISLL